MSVLLTLIHVLQIVLDNGPAQKLNNSVALQEAGDLIADPFEISTIRREVRRSYKYV